jgi:hypothetical protein
VAGLFKNGGQSLLEALHKITGSIWEREVIPKEWNTGLKYLKKEISWSVIITETLYYSI